MFIPNNVSCVMCHVLCFICLVSCVMCHVSRVMCHVSKYFFTLFIFIKKNTKWWSQPVECLLSTGPNLFKVLNKQLKFYINIVCLLKKNSISVVWSSQASLREMKTQAQYRILQSNKFQINPLVRSCTGWSWREVLLDINFSFFEVYESNQPLKMRKCDITRKFICLLTIQYNFKVIYCNQ